MKSDEDFVAALNQSQQYVKQVCDWFKSLGVRARVKPSSVRPDFASRFEFADEGDVEIAMRVEVKHRELSFTGRCDYPYPSVFVDEAYKVRSKGVADLFGYVILNKVATHAVFVDCFSFSEWREEKHYDRKDGQQRTFLACPTNLCRFFSIR